MKLLSLSLLLIGVASTALAVAPEIDPGTGMNALALLGGAALVIRSIRRK